MQVCTWNAGVHGTHFFPLLSLSCEIQRALQLVLCFHQSAGRPFKSLRRGKRGVATGCYFRGHGSRMASWLVSGEDPKNQGIPQLYLGTGISTSSVG